MIFSHLDFLDRHTLGLTSRHFQALIPPPIFDGLSAFEKSAGTLECEAEGRRRRPHRCFHRRRQGRWATCIGRKRLRLRTKFGAYPGETCRGDTEAYLCLEYGTRTLPGARRYTAGQMWWGGKKTLIRCSVCNEDGQPVGTGHWRTQLPRETDMCRSCYEKASVMRMAADREAVKK